MKDWLGNDLKVGNTVLYSSTSSLTGMNLGEITLIEPARIQVRILQVSYLYTNKGKIVTLHKGSSAYRSVTKYGDLNE